MLLLPPLSLGARGFFMESASTESIRAIVNEAFAESCDTILWINSYASFHSKLSSCHTGQRLRLTIEIRCRKDNSRVPKLLRGRKFSLLPCVFSSLVEEELSFAAFKLGPHLSVSSSFSAPASCCSCCFWDIYAVRGGGRKIPPSSLTRTRTYGEQTRRSLFSPRSTRQKTPGSKAGGKREPLLQTSDGPS